MAWTAETLAAEYLFALLIVLESASCFPGIGIPVITADSKLANSCLMRMVVNFLQETEESAKTHMQYH
jgi:hypothetical protein